MSRSLFACLAACLYVAAGPAAAKGGPICLDLDTAPGSAARSFAGDIGRVQVVEAAHDARLVVLHLHAETPVYRVTALLPGGSEAGAPQRLVAASPGGIATLEMQVGTQAPEAVCIER